MLGILVRSLGRQLIMLKHEKGKGIFYSITKTATTEAKHHPTLVPIHGIVFDLDGTLTLPVLDFAKLRKELQCPKGVDILEFCNSKIGQEKEAALEIVIKFEEEGRQNTKLQPGVFELLKFLSASGLKRALITRNLQASVDQFLALMGHPDDYGGPLTHSLTREFTPPKPDPAPLLHICRDWGVHPKNVVMVGDHLHDIQCGKSAGSVTILLNDSTNGDFKKDADFNVDSLSEIITLITSHERFSIIREDPNTGT